MKRLSQEDRAGLYITVIVHLAVLIFLLAASLGWNLSHETGFVLDFTKQEELEAKQTELERLQDAAALQQAISEKLNRELAAWASPQVRNVAVDRASLADDRGTDADRLYRDAERLARELNQGFQADSDEEAALPEPDKKKEQKKTTSYSGPSVVSYFLEGRKAAKLSIPAYRCMGAGEVCVLISVNNSGQVVDARVDESNSASDSCLRAFAIRAARLSRFSASPAAPARQDGNIVYRFIAQQ